MLSMITVRHLTCRILFWSVVCLTGTLFSAQEPDPFNSTKEQQEIFQKKIFVSNSDSIVWQLRDYNPFLQLHIVVIIPSYNNSRWYKKNLDSIFMQKYENYSVIYIDDCSTDNTGQLVEEYVTMRNQEHRVTVIKNKKRVFSLANIYKAVHMCQDTDIIATCDGDDWYCNENVLATLNKIYQFGDIWLTYGRQIRVPKNQLNNAAVPERIIKENKFRSTWNYSGLRTFYAWLFKKIRYEDFLYNGEFITSHCDGTYFYPMLEMAGYHQQFIPDVFYVANRATGINNFLIHHDWQVAMARYIHNKPPYNPLIMESEIDMIEVEYITG